MAPKPKDLQYEEAALRKRLSFVQELKESLQKEDSSCLIEEIALEVHKSVKTGLDDLSDVKQQASGSFAPPPLPHPTPSGKGLVDVFGNQVPPIALDQVLCPNCGRKVAAGRFAPHLEKCMGRGRQASRTAQRRLSSMAVDA